MDELQVGLPSGVVNALWKAGAFLWRWLQGMKITSHPSGELVPSGYFEIHGTYRWRVYDHIRLFTRSGHEYYVHESVRYDESQHRWFSKVHVSLDNPEPAEILLVACNEDITCLVEYFWRVMEKHKTPVGIRMERLPKGFAVLDQVRLPKPVKS